MYAHECAPNLFRITESDNTDTMKPPGFYASLQEESRLIPQHQTTPIIRGMRSWCDSYFAADEGHTRYWRHSHLPNVKFEAITLISCDIQRKCISSFEKLQLIAYSSVLRQRRE